MKGYKVFNPDWTCRGFQFEVGKTFEEDIKPECCKQGFHFCMKVSDCFKYYDFNPENKVAEVEALGDIDVLSDNTKHCTNKLHIIREITWQEVLELVNFGKSCTGLCNSGDYNSGNWNCGNYNSGYRNSGDYNSGNCNSGYCNSGKYNSGDYNSGYCNSGKYNSGDYNSGNCNSGYCNSGKYNSGKYNSGDYNSGDYNCGDWNKTCFSNGCFNTQEPKIFIFNKLSDWTYQDWLNSDARCLLMNCPSNTLSWIWKDDMTDEEKKGHPEYTVTGGFLKHVKKETERQIWWDKLSTDKKDAILNIPNFDKKIFKEITGITIKA